LSYREVLADPYFRELKTLQITQAANWIQFSVLAVARYQQQSSRYGSVIVIYTHVGELTLDGEAINFHESLKGAFTRAGSLLSPFILRPPSLLLPLRLFLLQLRIPPENQEILHEETTLSTFGACLVIKSLSLLQVFKSTRMVAAS